MPNSGRPGAVASGQTWIDAIDGLPLALVRARESVMAPLRNLLRRYDLTEPQWRVLKTISNHRSVELSELARNSALLMPSLSRIVRELEQRGYINKTVDPRDMRRMIASLTDLGQRLVAAALPECNAMHAQLRARFGADKIRRLETLLAEIEKTAAQLDPCSTVAPPAIAVAPAKRRGRPRKSVAG